MKHMKTEQEFRDLSADAIVYSDSVSMDADRIAHEISRGELTPSEIAACWDDLVERLEEAKSE